MRAVRTFSVADASADHPCPDHPAADPSPIVGPNPGPDPSPDHPDPYSRANLGSDRSSHPYPDLGAIIGTFARTFARAVPGSVTGPVSSSDTCPDSRTADRMSGAYRHALCCRMQRGRGERLVHIRQRGPPWRGSSVCTLVSELRHYDRESVHGPRRRGKLLLDGA